ncbi:Lipoprotein-releasing system ATP-binding protein LolD [Thalassoglobus neptunius]|uniref:Lipoprotein-releasing system ATP-binding protein LolD n=1 Tax=Thalassoglobus neptunius TaxID=1938619 RepID=A0A5C5W6U9_9PLAN|nr:ABC transporter ATP-binding protein [Thalassoglobus neptunius]TWT46334.1 Lipoprotein-releasing system ATP-binding protein LolD [Thalassoglobus neptunius]
MSTSMQTNEDTEQTPEATETALVDVSRLSKLYTGQQEIKALDDVSLKLHAGEFVVIRGASGSGKTTLLLTIGTLLRPDSGTLRIAGKEPYNLSNDDRARFRADKIGFVFQQFHLVPYLSVLENIQAPALTNPHVSKDDAIRLMEQFGLSDRSNHLASQLSSGERQRCALARAMVTNPSLLLADEPTGNLDEVNAEIVMKSLADFAQRGGTVLLVTHDLRNSEFADRTLKMSNGRILMEETGHAESN